MPPNIMPLQEREAVPAACKRLLVGEPRAPSHSRACEPRTPVTLATSDVSLDMFDDVSLVEQPARAVAMRLTNACATAGDITALSRTPCWLRLRMKRSYACPHGLNLEPRCVRLEQCLHAAARDAAALSHRSHRPLHLLRPRTAPAASALARAETATVAIATA